MSFNNKSNLAQVGIGEFIRKTIALNNRDFKKAMRLKNDDDNINEIEIIAQPMDTYDRN
ncbi:MAG: hypothetical protein LBB36_01775 [Fibromonadaceae bacterium]|jgi:hypothetical protein|nr:hypothetical protein [Fibromonadaceae bacterium]